MTVDVSPPRVSVIVPILNEEGRIEALLEHLLGLAGVHELFVVDGGSDDRSVALASARPGVRLLRSRRGRGAQMNAGARAASGEVLLFVHADVTLPGDAVRWIRAALSGRAAVAGAFRTWTIADVEPAPRWAPLLHVANLRSRYARLPYGDQALFVRAEVFRALGGFAEIELMEDLELSRRLARAGRVVTVPACVLVSGRRFLARPLFYLAVMNLFPLLYRLGVPPRALSALYGHVR